MNGPYSNIRSVIPTSTWIKRARTFYTRSSERYMGVEQFQCDGSVRLTARDPDVKRNIIILFSNNKWSFSVHHRVMQALQLVCARRVRLNKHSMWMANEVLLLFLFEATMALLSLSLKYLLENTSPRFIAVSIAS